VFDGTVNVPLLNVIVFSWAELPLLNTVPLKLMLAPPALAALNSASRRLQAESTGFAPGVDCGVHFVASPLSSAVVLTTKLGENSAVTLSVPFTVMVVLAELALATGSPAEVHPINA